MQLRIKISLWVPAVGRGRVGEGEGGRSHPAWLGPCQLLKHDQHRLLGSVSPNHCHRFVHPSAPKQGWRHSQRGGVSGLRPLHCRTSACGREKGELETVKEMGFLLGGPQRELALLKAHVELRRPRTAAPERAPHHTRRTPLPLEAEGAGEPLEPQAPACLWPPGAQGHSPHTAQPLSPGGPHSSAPCFAPKRAYSCLVTGNKF